MWIGSTLRKSSFFCFSFEETILFRTFADINKNISIMAMNDYVMVSPQVSHYSNWTKGQVIDIEDNPFRGKVITVRMENGDVFWDVEDFFEKLAAE